MSENITLSHLEEVIDEFVKEFLLKLEERLTKIRSYKIIHKPDFEILKPANKEYYEYKYLEKTLGCYIRNDLVKPVFVDLFSFNESIA